MLWGWFVFGGGGLDLMPGCWFLIALDLLKMCDFYCFFLTNFAYCYWIKLFLGTITQFGVVDSKNNLGLTSFFFFFLGGGDAAGCWLLWIFWKRDYYWLNLFLEEGGVCLVDEEVQSEQKAVLLVYAENELGSCKFWCWKRKKERRVKLNFCFF